MPVAGDTPIHKAVNLYINGKWNEKYQQTYGDISCWNVSEVTDMSHLFEGNTAAAMKFNADISLWDVSNVKDMSFMFNHALSFNQDISTKPVSVYGGKTYKAWDVSNVKDMSWMFNFAQAFNRDISKWDVSNVEKMPRMFGTATNFNQDISSWNVSNVKNMASMFYYATSFNQDISSWKFNSPPSTICRGLCYNVFFAAGLDATNCAKAKKWIQDTCPTTSYPNCWLCTTAWKQCGNPPKPCPSRT